MSPLPGNKRDQPGLIPYAIFHQAGCLTVFDTDFLPIAAVTAPARVSPGSGLVNIERTAADFLPVEIGDSRCGLLIGGHLNEAETA